jgi:hypothetical protein
MRNAYTGLVGMPTQRRLLGKLGCRSVDDTKKDLKILISEDVDRSELKLYISG